MEDAETLVLAALTPHQNLAVFIYDMFVTVLFIYFHFFLCTVNVLLSLAATGLHGSTTG